MATQSQKHQHRPADAGISLLLLGLAALVIPVMFALSSDDKSTPRSDVSPQQSAAGTATLEPPQRTAIFTLLGLLQYLFTGFGFFILSLLYTILWPVRSLLFPLFVFCRQLYGVLILAPVRFISSILTFLYPIYVFCGVACLVGMGLGAGGNGVAALFVQLVRGPNPRTSRKPVEEEEHEPIKLEHEW